MLCDLDIIPATSSHPGDDGGVVYLSRRSAVQGSEDNVAGLGLAKRGHELTPSGSGHRKESSRHVDHPCPPCSRQYLASHLPPRGHDQVIPLSSCRIGGIYTERCQAGRAGHRSGSPLEKYFHK
jgi:hypothetical protein